MTKIKEDFVQFKKDFNLKCFILEALLVIVIIALDLITKHCAFQILPTKPNNTSDFIPGFMNFVLVKNYGASFGIFYGKTGLLIAFTIISLLILMLIWIFYLRKMPVTTRLSIIFILAGGVGNLIDRIAFGYVRDFMNFTFFDFPVFNVADSFVVIGTFMLVIYLIVSLIISLANKKEKNEQ